MPPVAVRAAVEIPRSSSSGSPTQMATRTTDRPLTPSQRHTLTQVGHGDPVAAADVDPAQQGDKGRHAVICHRLDRLASRWHR